MFEVSATDPAGQGRLPADLLPAAVHGGAGPLCDRERREEERLSREGGPPPFPCPGRQHSWPLTAPAALLTARPQLSTTPPLQARASLPETAAVGSLAGLDTA